MNKYTKARKKKKKTSKKYLNGGSTKEDIDKMLTSMTQGDMTPVATNVFEPEPEPEPANEVVQWEPEPEPEPANEVVEPANEVVDISNLEQYPTLNPVKTQKKKELPEGAMGFLPLEIAPRFYGNYVDTNRYPDIMTCKQVKQLCELDPRYCKVNNFKDKYHKLCINIKRTNEMIRQFYRQSLINDEYDEYDEFGNLEIDDEDLFEYDEYIYMVNRARNLKLDEEVVDTLISMLHKHVIIPLMEERKYTPDEYLDISWYDVIKYLKETEKIELLMYEFGKELHNRNPGRYYPRIVERIKQKILREYFM